MNDPFGPISLHGLEWLPNGGAKSFQEVSSLELIARLID
jgi:hypothetical protein